jgi:hypothetical protein
VLRSGRGSAASARRANDEHGWGAVRHAAWAAG